MPLMDQVNHSTFASKRSAVLYSSHLSIQFRMVRFDFLYSMRHELSRYWIQTSACFHGSLRQYIVETGVILMAQWDALTFLRCVAVSHFCKFQEEAKLTWKVTWSNFGVLEHPTTLHPFFRLHNHHLSSIWKLIVMLVLLTPQVISFMAQFTSHKVNYIISMISISIALPWCWLSVVPDSTDQFIQLQSYSSQKYYDAYQTTTNESKWRNRWRWSNHRDEYI